MKTAVLYSGEARTFARCFDNQYWHLLRKLEEPEFFVSVADDADADDMTRMLLTRYPSDRIHFEKVVQPTLEEPAENPNFLGFKRSVPVQAILRQLWHLQRVWKFAEPVRTGDCERILRLRPDLAFTRFDWRENPWGVDCRTPWWGNWGGTNDRLAFLSNLGAAVYFTTHERVANYLAEGCPLQTEALLRASLEDFKIIVHRDLATEFVRVRKGGKPEPTDITMVDVVEYARTRP